MSLSFSYVYEIRTTTILMYKISICNIFIYISSAYKVFRLLFIYTYVYIGSNTDKRYTYLYFSQYLYLFSSNIY